MATEAELVSMLAKQGAELEAMRKQQTMTTIDTALLGAVSGSVHSAAAASQVVELLRDQITVVNDQNGKATVVGPGYRPVADFVQETLNSEGWAHFRKSSPAAAGSQPSSQGNPQVRQGVAFGQVVAAPDQNFGQALIQWGLANKAAAGDPRMDPSQPMGLKGRR